MNNLSENQGNAKQAFLDEQQTEMLARFENAGSDERAAILRQIDSFLPTLSSEMKGFWLSFRQKLERLDETNSNRFDLQAWYDQKIGGGAR